MKESEWLTCTDTNRMLKFLRSRSRHGWLPWQRYTFPEASERKLLLFACACFRRDVLRHPVRVTNRMLEAVSVVERWVDGQESESELYTARSYCWFSPPGNVWSAAKEAARLDAFAAGVWAGFDQAGFIAAMVEQCDLLRDIIGNPFRCLAVDSSWLTWNAGTVLNVAQTIYVDRAFDQLPILADALEEAGCSDPDLLEHLRGPGPHVRGCWAVDLILGRD